MKRAFRFAQWIFRHDRLPWLVMVLLVGLGLGAWLAIRYRQHQRASHVARPQPAAVVKPVVPDYGPLPADVAENFIRAKSQAERLRWVRHAAQDGPLMEEFFSHGGGAHETVSSLVAMDFDAEGMCASFAATLADGTQRLLCVVREDGAAKVDFKAYARHGSAVWDDLLTGKATHASELRVFIKQDNYYNYEFSNDERWQNLTATSPDFEAPLYFYMARNHPFIKMLEKQPLRRPVRVTVAVRSLGESHLKRQFEITKLLGSGWVLADGPHI
ncbi:MAG: hypothetical protein WCP35_11480 [Verrucomicrobiota bacterium]